MTNISFVIIYILSISCIALYLFINASNTEKTKERDFRQEQISQEACKGISFEAVSSTFLDSLAKPTLEEDNSRMLSETSKGVVHRVNLPNKGTRKRIFLTFDACGQGGLSDGYDSLLVRFLIENEIPASFFLSQKWCLKNLNHFEYIQQYGTNIGIYNHGENHIPISSKGDSVFDIAGTKNLEEIYYEVENSANFFCRNLGEKPTLFRAGTAYLDEIGVAFIQKMGITTVGFSVRGDGGASFSKKQVSNRLINSKDGDIIIFHLNHPESETREGVVEAIKFLRENQEVEFKRLYENREYFEYFE